MSHYKLTYFDFDGGRGGPLRIALHAAGLAFEDIRWSFPRAEKKDRNISSFIAGLGGRNITKNDLRYMVEKVEKEPVELEFLGLKKELISEKDL